MDEIRQQQKIHYYNSLSFIISPVFAFGTWVYGLNLNQSNITGSLRRWRGNLLLCSTPCLVSLDYFLCPLGGAVLQLVSVGCWRVSLPVGGTVVLSSLLMKCTLCPLDVPLLLLLLLVLLLVSLQWCRQMSPQIQGCSVVLVFLIKRSLGCQLLEQRPVRRWEIITCKLSFFLILRV